MRRAAPAPVAALAAEPSWVMAAPSSLGLDGTVSVSVGIVGSFRPAATHRSRAWALGLRGTDRKPIDTGRPFLTEGSRREVPYRAGEPARNWHLAGVAAGRLSWLQRAGPSATLDKAIQLPVMVRAASAPCQPTRETEWWAHTQYVREWLSGLAFEDGAGGDRVVDDEREHRPIPPAAEEEVTQDVDPGVGKRAGEGGHAARPVRHLRQDRLALDEGVLAGLQHLARRGVVGGGQDDVADVADAAAADGAEVDAPRGERLGQRREAARSIVQLDDELVTHGLLRPRSATGSIVSRSACPWP